MNNRFEAILTLNLFFIKNEKDYFDLNGEDYAYKVYIDTLSLKYFSKKQNISIKKKLEIFYPLNDKLLNLK